MTITKDQNHSRFKGSGGEEIAAQFLIEKNFKILEYNWHSGRSGELDLVAEDPVGTLVFVEVKRDMGGQAGYPEEWVHSQKQKQIGRIALRYCGIKGFTERSMRFDVIAITEKFGQPPVIRHYENAFFPPRGNWF